MIVSALAVSRLTADLLRSHVLNVKEQEILKMIDALREIDSLIERRVGVVNAAILLNQL